MSGKPASKKQDELPGPGTYEKPTIFQNKGSKSAMSKARRELNKS